MLKKVLNLELSSGGFSADAPGVEEQQRPGRTEHDDVGRARAAVADRVIGPVFIHHVAGRTLQGIRRHVEGTVAAKEASR